MRMTIGPKYACAFAFLLTAPCGFAADPPASAAIVGNSIITDVEVTAAIAPQANQLRKQEYDLKREALDRLIEERILQIEAKRRGITLEKLIELEVTPKVKEPTESELEAFYLGQTGPRPQGGELSDAAKASTMATLRSFRTGQARARLVKQLRANTEVRILLSPPRVQVDVDPLRTKGPKNAQVTIVEFSDFQCPYCSVAQETLKKVLAKYPGTVRLGFRDFPIEQLHPSAIGAAEASRCAAEQGKFWEYHDILFANQRELNANKLKEHASAAGLNRSQFDTCVDTRKHQLAVRSDFDAGQAAGVAGTPGFFINGQFISGAQDISAFERLIEEEVSLGSGRR